MSLYNLMNPAVKRLMKEAEELLQPTEEYHAQPIEDNLFEWHFTLRGPPNTDYEGGIYHGRITLPSDYPMKPPSIILLTPNGRFETNKKICLSISGHHPESWQPSWSIRTALLAIIGFMPTHGNGALGSLDYTPEERQQLALKSQDWKCPECGYIKDIFLKKKTTECQNENNHSSDLSSSEKKLNPHSNEISSKNSSNASSEKSASEHVPCKDEETFLVHRQKHSQKPTATVDAKETIRQDENNVFYSMFVFIIISIIIFLCFRRLLSM